MNKNEHIKSRNIFAYSFFARNEPPSDNFRRNFLAGSPMNHPSPPRHVQRTRSNVVFVSRGGPKFFCITQWCGKPSEWYSRRGIEIIGNIINLKERGCWRRRWRGRATLLSGSICNALSFAMAATTTTTTKGNFRRACATTTRLTNNVSVLN